MPPPPGSGAFLASTNGLASGNTREEAACHAVAELIERDAITLWYAQGPDRQAASALDPESVDDPACREVMDRCRAAGLETILWDVTSDLGVPAFQCLLIDARDSQGHGGLGGGCHPCREVALLRALTEAVQVRMTYISGARDDLAAAEYTTGARARRLAEARRLAGRDRGRRDLADVPDGRARQPRRGSRLARRPPRLGRPGTAGDRRPGRGGGGHRRRARCRPRPGGAGRPP